MTSRVWYGVAAAVLLCGFAVAGWIVWSGVAGLNDALQRVVVPGSAELTLAEPGTYTIFHERRSVVGDRVYVADNIAGLRDSPGLQRRSGSANSSPGALGRLSYSTGRYDGVSLLEFDIADPGRYRIAASYPDGQGNPTVIAIGHGFLGRLFRAIGAAIASGVVGAIAATVIFAITLALRMRMKARMRARAEPPGRFS